MLYCPKEALEKIDKLIFDFLWDGKPPKIKREIVVSNFSAGGIRMPDIFIVHKKAKISWIKRLAMDFNTNATWAKLMWTMLNFDKNDLNHKLPHSYIKNCVTPFHKQLMECWLLFKSRPPQNVEEIHNEYIFANKFVCSNNKPLKLMDFRGVHQSLKELTVKCIINDNGRFLTLGEIKERLKWNISIHDHNIIQSSLPTEWKRKMLDNLPSMNLYSNITVSVRGQLISLMQMKNKDIYWELIGNKEIQASGINTWIDLYPFLHEIKWYKIFNAVHHCAIETYLQSFQYKVVHRIINCKYNLYKWNIKENPFCIFCSHFDTIEHHFYLCGFSKLFWENVENWLVDLLKLSEKLTFTICEIMFGYSLFKKPNVTTTIINWIISWGKWFINYCRSKEQNIVFTEFLRIAKTKLSLYKNINMPAVEGEDDELYDKLKSLLIK